LCLSFIRRIAISSRLSGERRRRCRLGRGLSIECLGGFFRGSYALGKTLLLGGAIIHGPRLTLLRLISGISLLRLITPGSHGPGRHTVHLIGDLIGEYRHGLGCQQIHAETGYFGNGRHQGIAGAAEGIHKTPLFCLIVNVFKHDEHCIPISKQGNGAAAIGHAPGIDHPCADESIHWGLLNRFLRSRLIILGLHRLLHRRLGLKTGLLRRLIIGLALELLGRVNLLLGSRLIRGLELLMLLLIGAKVNHIALPLFLYLL